MLQLPEFSVDQIVRRCVLWAMILGFIVAGYFAYRHEHNRPKLPLNSQSGLKAVINPDSVLKDL
jgi:hypothetical protein